MPRIVAPIYLEGEAPGKLVFCPTCCEKTSCVTLNIRATTTYRNDQREINSGSGGFLKVNECQVCKCEFPASYNFETAAPFDYALLTSIVAMININRSYRSSSNSKSEHGIDMNDVLVVQDLLCRYSATSTYFTQRTILDHSNFLKHQSYSRVRFDKCLYPVLSERIPRNKKYVILDAIEGTATPGLGDAYRQEAAKILKIPSSPRPPPFSQSIALATDVLRSAVDEWHLWAHQGCQDFVSGIMLETAACKA